MVELGKSKMAIIFVGIGVAAGLGIALAVMSQMPGQGVFQRIAENDDIYGGDISLEERVKMLGYLSVSTHYKSQAEVGEDTTFVSAARGGTPPYQTEWKFSDGFTANTQNVTRSFSAPGQYDGQLIVKDSAGNTQDASITIRIVPSQ